MQQSTIKRKRGKKNVKKINEQLSNFIPDGAFRLVEEIIEKYQTKDEHEILEHVCREMEERYKGNSLEYHAAQMKMQTTEKILEVIGIYLIWKEIEPNITFRRRPSKVKENTQGQWKVKNEE